MFTPRACSHCTATSQNFKKSFTQTEHQSIVPARFATRVWLTNSPHSRIFTSVSVNSSPCSYLFTSATVRISVHTEQKLRRRKIGAAQLRTVTEIAPNRPFYRYGGHIELIGFKEYYGMPRGGMSTIRFTRISIYARFSSHFFFKFS